MMIASWIRSFFLGLAFLLAVCPSVVKLYESSHWFREGDPSQYDHVQEWFSNPDLLYANASDSKELMRLYFFIVPYVLSALALAVATLLPKLTAAPRKTLIRLTGRSILRKTISFPSILVGLGSPLRISVGEILGVLIFLAINLGTVVVRVKRAYSLGSSKLKFLADPGDAGKEPLAPFSWPACEVWAKTLGIVAIVNMGWYLLMPVGRRSVLLEALGLSWERAIKYHRWVGFYSILLMAVHGGMYVAVWIYGNKHPTYDPDGVMLKRNMVPGWGCDDTCNADQRREHRISMYGFVSLFLVLIMAYFALPWFRRNKFEWFYYVHHLFLPLLVFICLHYGGAILYLIPGIAMYSVDKLLGLLAYWKSGCVMMKQVSRDVLEFTVPLGPGVQYHAGQYVFLNVPEVSCLEWHPFSVTSAPHAQGRQLTFHVKNAGTWTNSVFQEAKQSSSEGLRVRLDGFYGHDVDDQIGGNKDAVVFVAGGIGVTPMMSMAMELLETRPSLPVTLLWVTRSVEEFQIFAPRLCKAMNAYGALLTVKVWITLNDLEATADEENAMSITKSSMMGLTAAAQCTRVISALQIPSPYEVQTIYAPAHPFVMDRSTYSPFFHVLISAVAIWMGMDAYVVAQVRNDQALHMKSKDGKALYQLSWVCGSAVAVVGLAILLHFLGSLYVQQRSLQLQNNGRVGLSINDEHVSSSKTAQDDYGKQSDELNETSNADTSSKGEANDSASKLELDEPVDKSKAAKSGAACKEVNKNDSTASAQKQEQSDGHELAPAIQPNASNDGPAPEVSGIVYCHWAEQEKNLLNIMLSGRIGCRPDVGHELEAVACRTTKTKYDHDDTSKHDAMGKQDKGTKVTYEYDSTGNYGMMSDHDKGTKVTYDEDNTTNHEKMGQKDKDIHVLKDIQVLACGPSALVQSVQAYCNETSVTWWSFFDFVEEDWEW